MSSAMEQQSDDKESSLFTPTHKIRVVYLLQIFPSFCVP